MHSTAKNAAKSKIFSLKVHLSFEDFDICLGILTSGTLFHKLDFGLDFRIRC
jgi:hypothetical protein